MGGKNVNVNLTTTATVQNEVNSDRLISLSALPKKSRQSKQISRPEMTCSTDEQYCGKTLRRFAGSRAAKTSRKLKEQVRAGKVEPIPDYSFITNPTVPPVIDTGYATFGSQVVGTR